MNILFLVGITIFLGTLAGKFFRRYRIPQVVSYILLGTLLGRSGLRLWDAGTVDQFVPVVNMALGIIGFMIGSELKLDLFRRRGRSIYAILFSETLVTFLVVAAAVTLITQKLYFGLLFGALASATAPAATVDVLWEYKTRGPLTSTLLAIVALDDALALVLYAFAGTFARSMITKEKTSLLHTIEAPFFEIGAAIVLGVAGGYVLFRLIRFIREKERILPFTLGVILLTVGLSAMFKIDLILASLVLGVTLTNFAPVESKELFESVKRITAPVYILFFVLVGARLDLSLFVQTGVAVLALSYVGARTAGKMGGAWLGGILGRAPAGVCRYLGLCLFSQAGVAIGLAMSIYHNLSHHGPEAAAAGLTILNVIVATTFIVQVVGPPCVRLAVEKAGEAWRDVTEEDIIGSYSVEDFTERDIPVIRENTPLYSILGMVRESDAYHFCVVDDENTLMGIISLGDLREIFLGQELELNHLVLARDVMVPATQMVEASRPLQEAVDVFRRRDIDYLPVVEGLETRRLVGAMNYRFVMAEIQKEYVRRRGTLEEAV